MDKEVLFDIKINDSWRCSSQQAELVQSRSKDTRAMFEIHSELPIKTWEWCHIRALMFSLLTLNKFYMINFFFFTVGVLDDFLFQKCLFSVACRDFVFYKIFAGIFLPYYYRQHPTVTSLSFFELSENTLKTIDQDWMIVYGKCLATSQYQCMLYLST